MSMASYEPDWDVGTEDRYETRLHVSSGLCSRCRNDAALPDDPDEFCAACAAEVDGIVAEVEAAA